MDYEIVTVFTNSLLCCQCLTADMSLHPSPHTDISSIVCNIYMEKQCKSDVKFEACFLSILMFAKSVLDIGLQVMGRCLSYMVHVSKYVKAGVVYML